MTESLGLTVGFLCIFFENTVPDTLGAHISFTHRFQHRQCSYNVPSMYEYLQCSANVLRRVVSCGLILSFQQVKRVMHCSCWFHIGVHKLIFLDFLTVVSTVTIIFLLGGELAPQVHQECCCCSTEHADKMIFPCFNFLFWNILSVLIRWYKLI